MESETIARAFAALGQTTRLDLLRGLLAAGATGMPAGDIADQLGIAPSTLSFHLRALEQAELIVVQRHGRSLVYAAHMARLRDLQEYNFTPIESVQKSLEFLQNAEFVK